MGIHFIKSNLFDNHVDPLTPEVLVYEPTKNGLKLVAIEYISFAPNQLFSLDFDPPGEAPFYSLHAWIWQTNPKGMFYPFNPNVANVPED